MAKASELGASPSAEDAYIWGNGRRSKYSLSKGFVTKGLMQVDFSCTHVYLRRLTKGVDMGMWVTLSSHQGRTVFSLLKASYKDFKSFCVKVWSAEDSVEESCEKEAGLGECLFENLKGGKIMTTSVLLKWDNDRNIVVKYLETKVPDCSTVGLKSIFKQRAEKELSTSHVVKVEQGSEVNKPLWRKKHITMKRMRSEDASGKKVQAVRFMCISRGLEIQALEEESSQIKKLKISVEHVNLKEKEIRQDES
ncbi:hypothetical protein PIB30_022559 [Stylosanthes scabra]|uniref:Uncharacterized protein n=1 Tax=Stylosanthes scabra TaxID=79078 RepID=A0ABU6Y9D9_9FABA|nr:hypothetical protein [Stylosanthes scabra]